MNTTATTAREGIMTIIYNTVIPWIFMLSFVGLILAAPAENQNANLPNIASQPPIPPENPQTPPASPGPHKKPPARVTREISPAKPTLSKSAASHSPQGLNSPSFSRAPVKPHKSSKRAEDTSEITSIEPHLHEALDKLHDHLTEMDPMAKTREQLEQKENKKFDKSGVKKARGLVNDVKYHSEKMARAVKQEYDEEEPLYSLIEQGKAEVRRANYQIDRVEKLIGKVGQ